MKVKLDKLASFRINSERWEEFKKVAETQGKTATDLLNEYIDRVIGVGVGVGVDAAPKISIRDIDKRIDDKINTASIQDIDDTVKKLIADSLEDGIVGDAIAKVQRKLADENNELQRQIYALEESLEQLKSEMLSKIDNILEKTSMPPSQQSPVTSLQSPVTSPQSPVTSPQSPVTSPQSPTEPAQIERSHIENIRTTLKRKGISATTEQIRAAFFAAGWDGSNYQEIRKNILEILSGAMP